MSLSNEDEDAAPARTENDARRGIVQAARELARLGLNHGSTGNLSLRWHRGGRDGCLVTVSGSAALTMSIDDIVWCALHDEPAPLPGTEPDDGPGERLPAAPRPTSEWPMHRALHRRADAPAAVVHCHAPFATALSCLPAVQQQGLPPFHYMMAMAGGDTIRCAPYATFGSEAIADGVVAAMADRRACLMASHGLVATGADLSTAVRLAEEVEYLAQVYWRSLQAGTPVLLEPSEIRQVVTAFSTYRPQA